MTQKKGAHDSNGLAESWNEIPPLATPITSSKYYRVSLKDLTSYIHNGFIPVCSIKCVFWGYPTLIDFCMTYIKLGVFPENYLLDCFSFQHFYKKPLVFCQIWMIKRRIISRLFLNKTTILSHLVLVCFELVVMHWLLQKIVA